MKTLNFKWLLLSIILSLACTTNAWGADFTPAQIASGTTTSGISVSSSFSKSTGKKLCTSQTSEDAISLATSAGNTYNSNYLWITVPANCKITAVGVLTKSNGDSGVNGGVVYWSGAAASTGVTSTQQISVGARNTSDCTTKIDLSVPDNTRTVGIYRAPKIKNGAFDSGGTAVGGTSTFNVFALSVTATGTVTHTLTNVSKSSGNTTATLGSAYNASYGASDGYTLPKTITVTINGSAATSGTDYTWNSSTGAFTVPAAKVNGAIVVTITGEEATPAKAYTVTAESNNDSYGSAEANDSSLDEGETTNVTATPETGYKFVSWEVSGTDASLSSTTDNPTTLTMGTENATVTATFRALYTYTISYGAGDADGVTGSKNSESKTEDAAFTLPSSAVFERDGYAQTGWNTDSDGENGDHYDLGGSYEVNAAQTFYPEWTELKTITYYANGGSGSMSATKGLGSTALRTNTFTNTGYVFAGWATSLANANAGTIAYADGANVTLSSADVDLYAVWYTVYYSFAPTETSGSLSADDVVATSTGGSMTYTPADGSSPTLNYTTNGLEFGGASQCQVTVTLNTAAAAGDIIEAKIYTGADSNRGLKIANSDGTAKANFSYTATGDHIGTYTIVAKDKIAEATTFKVLRNNNAYLKSLKVAKWVAPACSAPAAPSISGTTSYTAGGSILLTATCASGADASTTYTWYKGADWATASAASAVQAAATGSSGYTFTKSAVVADAGKYWCEASNGSGCEVHNTTGYTISVLCATAPVAVTSLTCSEQTSSSLTYTWTKASNASGYVATLYPDEDCEDTPVATETLGDVATVTFNTSLSASTTYYCKVQSKGNGTVYCEDGGTTSAVSGTTSIPTYTITNGSPSNGTIAITDGSSAITSAAKDATVYITATPSTGYSFSSWSVTETVSGNAVTLNDDDDSDGTTRTFAMPAVAVTVNASFSANSYTVTLDPDEGSSTSTVTATYGSAMPSKLSDGETAVSVPTYSGYTFGGYYDDHAGAGNQYYTDAVASAANWNKTSNTTLYAKWTQSVTIDDNGGSADGSVSVTYKGSAGTPSVPTYDGHTVDLGYYAESSCTNKVMALDGTLQTSVTDGSSVVWTNSSSKWAHAGSSTLYAHWKCNTPEISCTANTVTISVPSGATVYYTTTTDGSTPADPTSSAAAYNPESKPTISANTKIKAIAIQDGCTSSEIASATLDYVAYRVTYAGNGNTGGTVPTDDADYTSGSTVTVKAGVPTKTDYTFVGWLNSVDNTIYKAGQSFTITAATTLTALWDGAGTTVTLSWFDSSQGSSSSNKPDSEGKWIYGYTNSAKTSGYAYTITTTNTNNKGQGTEDSDYLRLDYGTSYNIYANNTTTTGTPSTFSNVTAVSLKVKLYKDAPTMTIKVGGTTIANAVSLSDANKSSFTTFTYNNLSNLSGKITITNNGSGSSNYNIFIDDITITCGVPATGYTVTFDKGGQDGATGMPANIVGVPSGKKIAEPLETPTLAGYTFDGWVTTLGGSTLFDFANTTITADKTIYAKWTALPASTTPTLPSLSNTEACAVGDFDTWNATPTNATTISAAGETVTYSWKNSSDVEVANTASYEPAAGTYTVTVTVSKAGQADASVTSDALTATLNTAASKTADPTATIAAIEGESFTISGLTASNATGYQWYSCNSTGGDKSELTGKTSATLTDTKEDAGTYYYICTIGNACGDDIDSRVVTVNVYDKCATFTSATSKQSETEAGTTKTISTETGGYAATLSGATMTFKGTSSAVGCNKDHGLVFDANDDVLTVTLIGGSLQAGTIIELGGKTVNENSKIFIFMVGSNAASPTYTTTEAANQAFTQRYVVEAGDGICGTSSFTITKSSSMTGSKEYLNKLIVANCALCTPISPTLTYSTSMLYAEPVPTTATATLTGYYGTPTISYASSNTSVATVNETTGEVTAVAPGTATITATIGETTVSTTDYCGAIATCVITVAGCGVQEIAGVTLTAKDAGTPSGTLIASTSGYGVNTQAWDDQSSNDGCDTGGKIGSGTYYVFLTLSSGNYFHNGDVVKLDLAKVSDVGDKNLHIYVGTTEVGTEIGTKDSPVCNVNEIVLTNVPDNTSSITLHRNDGNATIKQNPYVKSMKVYREICSDGLAKFTGAEDSDWDKTANWTGGKMPTSEDRVVITNNMTVNVTTAQAKEIILDQSSPNTGKLTIGAGQALVVAGTIKKWNGTSLVATTAAELKVESSSTGTGALVVGEKSTNTRASVEFYTKACYSGGYVNQYIGIPFDNTMRAYDGYYGTYIYKFNVDEDKWNVLGNNAYMEPFAAYNIMRDEATPTTLGMGGTLNLPGIGDGKNIVRNLKRRPIDVTNSVNTENLFANSWVAPIDIKTMVNGDFVGAEATVYIFNAGTYAEQQANKGTMDNNDNTNAGQWVALPVNATDLLANSWSLTVIPSMQAFAVFATGDVDDPHTLTLDYKKHVYDPAKAGGAEIKPTRSPEMRQSANEHIDVLQLFVMGENGARDNLYVLIGDEFTNSFDNGWDGRKLSGSAWAPKMYAVSEDGEMAIHAVPEAEGTVIGFRAGQDNNYTFTFRYEGNDVLYLNDMLTEQSTRISEGFNYDFTTADGDIETRFVISHTPFVKTTPTGMDNVQGDEGQSVRKLFYQGVMYIIRGGRIYNAEGARIQ